MLAPPKSFKHADGPATMGRQQGMVQPMPASLCPPAHPTDMAHGRAFLRVRVERTVAEGQRTNPRHHGWRAPPEANFF